MAALLVSLALGCEHCERGLGRPLPKSCTGRDVHDIDYEAPFELRGQHAAYDSDDETLVLAAATTSVEPDPFDDLPPWALAVVEEAVATAHAVRTSEDHGLD